MKSDTPSWDSMRFKCPHCNAFAHHDWSRTIIDKPKDLLTPAVQTSIFIDKLSKPTSGPVGAMHNQANLAIARSLDAGHLKLTPLDQFQNAQVVWGLWVAVCASCFGCTFWIKDQMVYPRENSAPQPNTDMPDDAMADYREAALVADQSPRAAAALLRLCIEKLCWNFGGKRDSLDTTIGKMVSDGLPNPVKLALDSVRIVGNEAVHPGTMDLKDDKKTALVLFDLVNFICDFTITRNNQAQALFDKLPENKKEGVERRDKNSLST